LAPPVRPYTAAYQDEQGNYETGCDYPDPQGGEILRRAWWRWAWGIAAVHARRLNDHGEHDRPGNNKRAHYYRNPVSHHGSLVTGQTCDGYRILHVALGSVV